MLNTKVTPDKIKGTLILLTPLWIMLIGLLALMVKDSIQPIKKISPNTTATRTALVELKSHEPYNRMWKEAAGLAP
jgi:hypothetical protein